MATFFTGLVIGFVNCWQIALITLATGPFIVAAGGISNIFLHRLAENIQDAYAEAASIAEQVYVYASYFCRYLLKKKKRKRIPNGHNTLLPQKAKGKKGSFSAHME